MNQKPTNRKVKCPACGRQQEDRGKRSTCIRCAFQPLPSYAYSCNNVFHPDALVCKGIGKITALK